MTLGTPTSLEPWMSRLRLLLTIGAHQVGDRPDRVEPRARKRRPKDYPNLRGPRHEARSYRYAKR